jgi:hypothetical protein
VSTFDAVLAAWLVLSAPVSFLAGMFMTSQNREDEGWMVNVGECPVPPDARVDLLLAGDLVMHSVMAGDWVWYRDSALLSEGMTIHFWRVAA